jgi:hypothetical protein
MNVKICSPGQLKIFVPLVYSLRCGLKIILNSIVIAIKYSYEGCWCEI